MTSRTYPSIVTLSRRLSIAMFILFSALISNVQAQSNEDSVMTNLKALRNDYIGKIISMGYKPSREAPEIVLDNPPGFGNYNDTTNVLHICDWKTLPSEGRAVFDGFARSLGEGMTGEKFFKLAVHKWIFVHELGHWWRACQHQTADLYEEEKGANRLTSAYWNDREPDFYKFMMLVFNGLVNHSPSPIPNDQPKEKYFDANYYKLAEGPAYTWYQSIMIVEVSKETPFETFKQAVKLAGKPLSK